MQWGMEQPQRLQLSMSTPYPNHYFPLSLHTHAPEGTHAGELLHLNILFTFPTNYSPPPRPYTLTQLRVRMHRCVQVLVV